MNLTKEQYEKLLPFKDQFYRIEKANYFMPLSKREEKAMYSVLSEVTGEKHRPQKCSKCQIDDLRILSGLFYAYTAEETEVKTSRKKKTKQEEILSQYSEPEVLTKDDNML